jgi:hypothetical protein
MWQRREKGLRETVAMIRRRNSRDHEFHGLQMESLQSGISMLKNQIQDLLNGFRALRRGDMEDSRLEELLERFKDGDYELNCHLHESFEPIQTENLPQNKSQSREKKGKSGKVVGKEEAAAPGRGLVHHSLATQLLFELAAKELERRVMEFERGMKKKVCDRP